MLLSIIAASRREDSPLTFPRAPRVQAGEAVTSRQLAGLAQSFNARLRSGLGDGAWRIAFYVAGLFRQMRNPDGYLWPAQHEFFTAYQMVPPDAGEWPLMGPGEPAGANVASPIPAYIWGNEAVPFGGEEERLGYMPWSLNGFAPASDAQLWELGKRQRGAHDPVTGVAACPAWDAARSWTALRYSLFSPHANAYGGFMPMPEIDVAVDCVDTDIYDDIPAPVNYLWKFTGVSDEATTVGLHGTITTDSDGNPVVSYAGSCWAYDSDSDGELDTFTDHVAFIIRTDYEYVVFLWDGSIDYLPANLWQEGPYTGSPRLTKTVGNQMHRALAAYCREFRGADQEVAAANALAGAVTAVGRWNRNAFDTQRFQRSQYLLAPARGSLVGEYIAPVYPAFEFPVGGDNRIAAQTAAELVHGDQTGTAYTVHSASVVAGALVSADALFGPATVDLFADGALVASVAIEAGDDGSAAVQRWFGSPVAAGQQVTCKVRYGAAFSELGHTIRVEMAELYEYRPDLNDLLLALRVQGALAGG
jgi:hypothetical protein